MGRVRVSVCAVRDDADVDAVVRGGADAVGVLVDVRHQADDDVSLAEAARLLHGVPPYVGRYAVTHAADLDRLRETVDRLPVDTVQVHDAVDPDTLGALREAAPWVRILKALPVTSGVPGWSDFKGVVDGFVLDSVDLAADRIGGTGLTHDWRVSRAFVEACPLPVVLAGGLTPGNAAEAVHFVRPWAVNVNSGVEAGGRKDEAMVRAFVGAAARRRAKRWG